MADQLPVDLNRSTLHDIEVPHSFEATGSFTVALRNHGGAVHVHLHLDDALSAVADIEAVNHYVREGATRPVQVEVREGVAPVRGSLKVVTGYGAETRYVDVNVVEAPDIDRSVEIDESLATPQPDADEPGLAEALPGGPRLPVAALVGIALVLAVAAVAMAGSAGVYLGALAVLAGIAAAGYILRA